MAITTVEVATAIQNVGARLRQQMTSFGWGMEQPLSQIVGGYNISLSAGTLAGYADIVAARVSRLTKLQLDTDGFGVWLEKLPVQLDLVQFGALNQGQSFQLTNALSMLQMIDAAIPIPPPREPKVNWEDLKDEKDLLPRDLKTRLRSVAVRLDELEPRSNEIAAKIADIENAHAAADQLPTDLAELAEKKVELATLVSDTQRLADGITASNVKVAELLKTIQENAAAADLRIAAADESADSLLLKSEQALRGATSVGLSKSFSSRKEALARTSAWWTAGLIIALIAAIVIGWERVSSLREILNGDKPATVILVNALLAMLGVGAPVWFAWLSTKQIGTTFRLSEDYAFKASVAQAYEGYRSEAMTIDENLRNRLFSSALDRFEEAPIRLIDSVYHSSPLQEVLGNPALRKALEGVPGIADKIIALIPSKAGKAAAIVAPVPTIGAVALNGTERPENEIVQQN